jgi:hypothetical protein
MSQSVFQNIQPSSRQSCELVGQDLSRASKLGQLLKDKLWDGRGEKSK